jgi:hypothetical protein
VHSIQHLEGALRSTSGGEYFVYYCEAASEQRAARCIVAPGVLFERGLPRDVE